MVSVSVIIPVYNGRKFLKECIDSLLNQTLNSIEFIFVNDGSTDGSEKIIAQYQQSDERIVLVNQNNQGVSEARNTGIRVAKGSYIGFVDSDDFIEKDMYANLYNATLDTNPDIVISGFFADQGKNVLHLQYDFPTNQILDKAYIRSNIMLYLIEKDSLNNVWNKIFKREFILQNEILFPKAVKLGEDAIFNMKAFNQCANAYYINYAGYHYREVAGSATRESSHDYFSRVVETYNFDYKGVMEIAITDGEYDRLRSYRLINSALSLVHFYSSLDIPLFKRLSEIRSIISHPILQKALDLHSEKFLKTQSPFGRQVLKSVIDRNLFKLYILTLYSKIRNS